MSAIRPAGGNILFAPAIRLRCRSVSGVPASAEQRGALSGMPSAIADSCVTAAPEQELRPLSGPAADRGIAASARTAGTESLPEGAALFCVSVELFTTTVQLSEEQASPMRSQAALQVAVSLETDGSVSTSTRLSMTIKCVRVFKVVFLLSNL